jgi:hypothetical protein
MTIKNRYPLPLISELLDRIKGAKYFTKIDVRDAFNRLRIALGHEFKTAFRTRYGHFEYLVMPFGLTNAPGSFQGYINEVIRECLDRFAVAYMDDILIYSNSLEEHIIHVRTILKKLLAAGLYAKIEKCEFHVQKVSFLGFIVSSEGISMDPERIRTVAEWPVPKSVLDIQVFLGFSNFYRRFIDGYSRVVLPITHLLRKGQQFAWSVEAQAAFDRLKFLSLSLSMRTPLGSLYPASCHNQTSMESCILSPSGLGSASLQNATTISTIGKCSPLSNALSTGATTSKDPTILFKSAPITRTSSRS